MQEWMASLLELQQCDLEQATLEEELNALPDKAAQARAGYDQANAIAKEAKEAEQAQSLAIRNIENEIQALQEKHDNFKAKSSLIRNNDEFRAMLIQIETCEHAISDAETRQLEAMDALEELKAKRQAADADVEAKLATAKADIQVLRDRKAAITARIENRQAQRPSLASAVPKAYLSLYERLRTARNNTRTRPCVVPVILNEHGAQCGRCHLTITTQVYNSAILGHLTQCSSCGAILYGKD